MSFIVQDEIESTESVFTDDMIRENLSGVDSEDQPSTANGEWSHLIPFLLTLHETCI